MTVPRRDILHQIGHTPRVPLRRVARGLPLEVLVKCAHLNPGGSVKDRIALAIVEDAEARGGLDGPVVTLLPDSWDRYRTRPWMQEWAL